MAGYEGFLPKPFTATQAEKEEAFVKAKAEEEAREEAFVEVGRGSKRKAEEDREEAPAAVPWKGADATTDEVVYEDDDSDSDDDDPETCLAKMVAQFDECVRENRARRPWLKYKDYSVKEEEDSGSDDDGAVVDALVPV